MGLHPPFVEGGRKEGISCEKTDSSLSPLANNQKEKEALVSRLSSLVLAVCIQSSSRSGVDLS